MRFLHTSDWHLGRALYGRHRYEEFERFLAWMIELIADRSVDVLLVAGDVFDNGTPSNRALALYYRFLRDARSAGCQHVVVIGGNHDSPSLLEAPRALLEPLAVHVVGQAREDFRDEVLLLRDADGEPAALIGAVPFLRDRDLRTVGPGETGRKKQQKLTDSIREHYRLVTEHAVNLRNKLSRDLPIVFMGHLYTAGGRTVEGDGVREMYVGHQGHVPTDIFSSELDYLALGHLHVAQTISGADHKRYCGSPIPIGFGEANQVKEVVLVSNVERQMTIEEITVPCFQRLARVQGDWDAIESTLIELSATNSSILLDIHYDGPPKVDLRDAIGQLISGTQLEALSIRNKAIDHRIIEQAEQLETLDDLSELDVFRRCLEAHDVAAEHWSDFEVSFHRVLTELLEEDRRAQ